jgi:hypothetical protein
MLPATEDISNSIHLILVDKKKHFEHTTRRGEVTSVGLGIYGIVVGDVVVFGGAAGFTLDGDPEFDRPEKGEEYRWLKPEECLAVEDAMASEEAVV